MGRGGGNGVRDEETRITPRSIRATKGNPPFSSAVGERKIVDHFVVKGNLNLDEKKAPGRNTRRFIDPDEKSRPQLLEGQTLTYLDQEHSRPAFHPVLLKHRRHMV